MYIGLCVCVCNVKFRSQICLLAVIQEAVLQEGSLDRLVMFDIIWLTSCAIWSLISL